MAAFIDRPRGAYNEIVLRVLRRKTRRETAATPITRRHEGEVQPPAARLDALHPEALEEPDRSNVRLVDAGADHRRAACDLGGEDGARRLLGEAAAHVARVEPVEELVVVEAAHPGEADDLVAVTRHQREEAERAAREPLAARADFRLDPRALDQRIVEEIAPHVSVAKQRCQRVELRLGEGREPQAFGEDHGRALCVTILHVRASIERQP
jgi:hypothetical protein